MTYRKHSKALAELQPLVDAYREHQTLSGQLADARDLASAGDADMAAMAKDEIAEIITNPKTLRAMIEKE